MYILQTQESVCNISIYNVLYISYNCYKLIICLMFILYSKNTVNIDD